MAKVLGRALYSAYRQDRVLYIAAQGEKPNLQTKVTIEQLPIRIYPPHFALYFESEGIVNPIQLPFEIERAFPTYPLAAKVVNILDASGRHTITIETREGTKAALEISAVESYCVFQQIGTDNYVIAKCDTILPAIYYKVFGPASYLQCQEYIAEHTRAAAPGVYAKPETFNAWIDKMPPGPPKLVVIGDVLAEIDLKVELLRASPQGINPLDLILNIKAELPSDSSHSNAIATRSIRYVETPPQVDYTNVTVTGGGDPFTIPVQIVV